MGFENEADLKELCIRLLVFTKIESQSEKAMFHFNQAREAMKQVEEAIKKGNEAVKEAEGAENEVKKFFRGDDPSNFIQALLEQRLEAQEQFKKPQRIPFKFSPEILEEIIKALRAVQRSKEQEAKAVHKLSQLQKDILLKLLAETNGYDHVKWTPAKWFGAKEASERATFSTSLKRLEIRGLLKRQPVRKKGKTERAPLVRLTSVGYALAKQLTTENSAG